jgi:hypothetical protein
VIVQVDAQRLVKAIHHVEQADYRRQFHQFLRGKVLGEPVPAFAVPPGLVAGHQFGPPDDQCLGVAE